eukprot:scaffold3768_cov376-Prasinococcus_capsulatus_cf.AAC.27
MLAWPAAADDSLPHSRMMMHHASSSSIHDPAAAAGGDAGGGLLACAASIQLGCRAAPRDDGWRSPARRSRANSTGRTSTRRAARRPPHILAAAEPGRAALWGGAMSVVMPAGFADVSKVPTMVLLAVCAAGGGVLTHSSEVLQVRPVPDNQEIWGDADRDRSVVLELLEHTASVSDGDSLAFFFNDLADANEAASRSVEAVKVGANVTT